MRKVHLHWQPCHKITRFVLEQTDCSEAEPASPISGGCGHFARIQLCLTALGNSCAALQEGLKLFCEKNAREAM
jgi:hypothetical protein